MGKSLIIAGVAGVLIIAAAAAYLTVGKPASTSPTPTASIEVESTETASTESKSLKDLMAMGQNQSCTFEDETGNSGSVYASSGRVRGDFATNINGKLESSHLLVDGQYAHIWTEGMANGIKISLDAIADIDTTSAQQSVDIDEKVDFDCSPWSVDASLFVPPASVQFTDYSSMMAPVATGTAQTTDNSSQCATCQNLTGTYRDQCLQALSCN